MTVLYADCSTGASGDMLLAALLDLLPSPDPLLAGLRSLPLPDWRLETSLVRRRGITGRHVQIHAAAASERHLTDILELLARSELPAAVQDRAESVFRRLAAAEGRIHGLPPEQIHFHEVGAVDAIIDIVGVVLGLHLLAVEHLYFSPLPFGRGTISCQHGLLPNPAPATLELLTGTTLYPSPLEGELVTPTGAALLSTLGRPAVAMPPLQLTAIGYGAGSRELAQPNILRLWLGTGPAAPPAIASAETEPVGLLETMLDDINPEWLPYFREQAEAAGALDLWWYPVTGKKGRTGFALSVLVPESRLPELAPLLFAETTTLGVRWRREQRLCLERRQLVVHTPLGPILAKQSRLPAGPPGSPPREWRTKPEYESCRSVARQHGLPLPEVYAAFWRALAQQQR